MGSWLSQYDSFVDATSLIAKVSSYLFTYVYMFPYHSSVIFFPYDSHRIVKAGVPFLTNILILASVVFIARRVFRVLEDFHRDRSGICSHGPHWIFRPPRSYSCQQYPSWCVMLVCPSNYSESILLPIYRKFISERLN